MIPLTLPDASGVKPVYFTVLMTAMMVLAGSYIGHLLWTWPEYLQSGERSAEADRRVPVQVGSIPLSVPLGFVVSTSDRHQLLNGQSQLARLKLTVPWQKGTATAPAGTFDLELEQNAGMETLRDRLNPVFRRLARGGERQGPAGLTVLTLSAEDSAATDRILFEPDRSDGFITRCLRDRSGETGVCHRAVTLENGLTIRYRFEEPLLADWRQVDDAVVSTVRSLFPA